MEIYFNRPRQSVPLHRLYADVEKAKHRLVIASAWFTLTDLAEAFLASTAKTKLMLLSHSDLSRSGGHQAVTMLKEAANVWVLGTTDFRTGTMHHKFICADQTVWFGSYNFTFQANRNYETLARCEDAVTSQAFYLEACALTQYGTALRQVAQSGGTVRPYIDYCSVCGACWSSGVEGYVLSDSHGGCDSICQWCWTERFERPIPREVK